MTIGVDGSGEECLADTGFSHNHQWGSAVGKGGDPLLQLDNGGAASYDLEGIQSSGPEEAEQVGLQGERSLVAGGLLDSRVSGTRKSDYLERK